MHNLLSYSCVDAVHNQGDTCARNSPVIPMALLVNPGVVYNPQSIGVLYTKSMQTYTQLISGFSSVIVHLSTLYTGLITKTTNLKTLFNT